MNSFLRFLQKLIATFLGLGFSPIAPGTIGSIGGLLFWYIFQLYCILPNITLLIFIIVFFVSGVYSSFKLEAIWGKDPSKIVVDEVVGMWISLFMLPFKWEIAIGAFILFRFFDIAKPLLIRKMENFKGGWGVMMDDVLAGLYSNLILQIINLSGIVKW
ncbi:MAG: phosphatidylglycerophosphatase A [Bacteroidota bacterium]|nr:phosphatidylglycerophosphatase A [Bacteroidota bacterium]